MGTAIWWTGEEEVGQTFLKPDDNWLIKGV
jgi:hypothetical protein